MEAMYNFTRAMTEKRCVLCDYRPEQDDVKTWANSLVIHFSERHFGELPWMLVRNVEKHVENQLAQ